VGNSVGNATKYFSRMRLCKKEKYTCLKRGGEEGATLRQSCESLENFIIIIMHWEHYNVIQCVVLHRSNHNHSHQVS
jgi:hypothetical protein